MMWFGPSWGAPVCEPSRSAATPVGQACDGGGCPRLIADSDQGVLVPRADAPGSAGAYHLTCWLRAIGIEPCVLHGVVFCNGTGHFEMHQDGL